MSWRNHKTHREETKAVKDALKKASVPVSKVGHGTGTGWAWLEIWLDHSPDECEHTKQDGPTPWLCRLDCPECERIRDLRNKALKVVWDVTGRTGDYNGQINIT